MVNVEETQKALRIASEEISESVDLIIEIKGLWRKFFEGTPAEVQALRGVDFRVERGEFITIMGPSGSGKSLSLIHI